MYHDEIYEKARKEAQEESYQSLKAEIKGMETLIEQFLTQILECSATISERDFNACGI